MPLGISLPRRTSQILGFIIWTALTTAAFMLFLHLSTDGYFIHIPLHSSIEGIGSVLAAWIGIFLLRREQSGARLRIVSSAFIGMSILDAFHSCAPTGDLFVFFRSTANFIGGAIAARSFLGSFGAWQNRWRPWVVAFIALSIGVIAFSAPDLVPTMQVDHGFSGLAVAMNVAAGIFFLCGAAGIYQEYRLLHDPLARSLIPVLSIFGLSGLLFQFSEAWDLTWWFWHWLRVSSYAIVFEALLSILLSSFKDLALANELKTRFMDIASHELRTPLTALNLRVALFERKQRDDSRGVTERDLASLRPMIYRLIRMVDELLDISRLERGSIELKRETVNLVELVSRAVEDFRLVADQRMIQLELPSSNEILVTCDPMRIVQVIENLLSNAIRYSNPQTPIQVRVQEIGSKAQVEVRDQGAGINAEDLKRIFEPYYRAERKQEAQIPGLGLGLYISKQIAELHGGDIRVESRVGEGSQFTLILPVGGPN